MRRSLKTFLWGVSFSCFAFLLADFCHDKTKGFQRQRIAPAFSFSEKTFSSIPENELLTLLNEPFTYLKKGRSSYVFVSADQKHVLKFLRNPPIAPHWWTSFAISQKIFPSFCQNEINQKQKRREKQEKSYQLAFHKIPLQTAILCLHLHASCSLQKKFTIYDAIGIKHKIPMDTTAFILQKKADPFCPYFEMLYNEKKQEEIERVISQFAALLKERADHGICDHDLSPRYNLGILEGKLITFDLDSLILSPTLASTAQEKKHHMRQDAKKMLSYLRSFSPNLELLLEEEIEKFSYLS